jgi:hypothetical protein
MNPPPQNLRTRLGILFDLDRLGDLALQRTPRLIGAWLVLIAAAWFALNYAWHSFDDGERRDGNSGHLTIDFGGQWLMGRMVVEGHGRQLYNRVVQREVLREAYPRDDEKPDEKEPDYAKLMSWTMGFDDASAARVVASFAAPLAGLDVLSVAALVAAGVEEWTPERYDRAGAPQVGGALYPPVQALLFSPLAALPPRIAYRCAQVINIVLILLAGLAVQRLSEGRFWWPLASVFLMYFPGFAGSVNLGQNASLSLAILLWGWVLVARGKEARAGMLWGFLAFKPVWAVAFFLVPVLTRRWRMALAMLLTGTALAALTLPVVGVASWRNWLETGKVAAGLYDVDENWIALGRDMLGLPRRWLLDFDVSRSDRNRPVAGLAGYALMALVLEATARLAFLRRRQARATTGYPAACVILSAWMCCFHFMYYDTLLAAFPVCLLLADPWSFLRPRFWRHSDAPAPPLCEAKLAEPADAWASRGSARWVLNSMTLTLIFLLVQMPRLDIDVGLKGVMVPPWDQVGLIALWMWCAGKWLVTPERQATDNKQQT